MGNEVIRIGDIDIGRIKFHRYKDSIFLYDVGINNILISGKTCFRQKNCIF